MDLLETKRIFTWLDDKIALQIPDIHVYHSLDSTNSWLLQQANLGAAKGLVCLAEQQITGRGRGDNVWESPSGGNIYLSILWHYNLLPSALGGLSLACGVAVLRVLLKFDINGLTLKWPNDVLWNNRKLAGLLLEVRGNTAGRSSVVVGLGLNVRMPPQATANLSQPWVALEDVLAGLPCERNCLVALLLNEFVSALNEFGTTGLTSFLPVWAQYDGLVGKRIKLLAGTEVLEGDYAGVAVNGSLQLNMDGVVISCYSGEVKRCRPVTDDN